MNYILQIKHFLSKPPGCPLYKSKNQLTKALIYNKKVKWDIDDYSHIQTEVTTFYCNAFLFWKVSIGPLQPRQSEYSMTVSDFHITVVNKERQEHCGTIFVGQLKKKKP